MPATAALVSIVLFAGFFACVFGIYYLQTRQNLAMIDKGMNPKMKINRPAPYKNLKWALLLLGAGVGLFLAYLLDEFVFKGQLVYYNDNGTVSMRRDADDTPIYFALIAIGGGAGLFISYLMEKKWWDENKDKL